MIELKKNKAGKSEIEQVIRYVKWLKLTAPDIYDKIKLYLYAPCFTRTVSGIVTSSGFEDQIELVAFNDDSEMIQSKIDSDFS